jgi:hypothetical protein
VGGWTHEKPKAPVGGRGGGAASVIVVLVPRTLVAGMLRKK